MSRGRKSILPEAIQSPLARRMRQYRLAAGISLDEVGVQLGGKARQTLSNIECGREPASREIVVGYQRIFCIADDELVNLWKVEREHFHGGIVSDMPNTTVAHRPAESTIDLSLGSIRSWLNKVGIADVWSRLLAMLNIQPNDPAVSADVQGNATDIEHADSDDLVLEPTTMDPETSKEFAPLGEHRVLRELQKRRQSPYWNLVDVFLVVTVDITIENGNLSAHDRFSAAQAAMTRCRERIAEFHGTNLRIWLVGIVATESYELNQRNAETNRSLGEMRKTMEEASTDARSNEVVGRALYDFCHRYPDPNRTALILSLGLYKGYESQKIASRLHMPLARVRQIVRDANRRLQASVRSIEISRAPDDDQALPQDQSMALDAAPERSLMDGEYRQSEQFSSANQPLSMRES